MVKGISSFKIDWSLNKNHDLAKISGSNMLVEERIKFTYVPLVSVERFFLQYIDILRDNCSNLTPANIEQLSFNFHASQSYFIILLLSAIINN